MVREPQIAATGVKRRSGGAEKKLGHYVTEKETNDEVRDGYRRGGL
jgi:hypothetical protein